MKFEWEVIHERRGNGVSDVTLRARVFGGWVVKSVYCDESSCKLAREHAMVFVQDSDHRWSMESE
jgi:hypothetical protein